MNKELKKLLRNFVKEVDEEISPTFIEGESYYFETTTNRINIDISDTEDCGFMRHLKEKHYCDYADTISTIVWAILHEIGHYNTENEIDWDADFNDRFALACTNSNVKYNKKVQDMYFDLPSEFAATEWAIDYVEHNFENIMRISKLIENLKG